MRRRGQTDEEEYIGTDRPVPRQRSEDPQRLFEAAATHQSPGISDAARGARARWDRRRGFLAGAQCRTGEQEEHGRRQGVEQKGHCHPLSPTIAIMCPAPGRGTGTDGLPVAARVHAVIIFGFSGGEFAPVGRHCNAVGLDEPVLARGH